MAQACNGYLQLDAESDAFSLSPEAAMVFSVKDSPGDRAGAFDLVAAMIDAEEKVEAAFRSGEGVGWGDSGACLFCAVGAFFRPGYVNNIVQSWIPALDGVKDKLTIGGRVADIGCGVGFSTLLMAKAYPAAEFVGFDFHEPSIVDARRHAVEHGLADRVRFEVARAKEIEDRDFDLITAFDCLHDMGDPEGCARHIRQCLKPDGTWMLCEPIASDRAAENVGNPVSRLYYNASTMICVPTALDQEVGLALGAQAGEAKLSEVIKKAGFTSVRRATEGPFNMILEARP
jgi:2-polyprenyl-3-methyl-5-hydroxy-6-metoxy-1,4-benzoquinol methylase